MEKEFVTYEQALALKELGFDESCLKMYTLTGHMLDREGKNFFGNGVTLNDGREDMIAALLYQQAFRWFREEHGYYTEMFVDDNKTFGFMITYFINEGRVDKKPIQRKYPTYEEAEKACLDKLIEIVKNK